MGEQNERCQQRLRAFLESNGDSVVVIEDDEVINCHVHTADRARSSAMRCSTAT